MNDESSPSAAETRRRWLNLGEAVAIVGLIISGLALWNSWRTDDDDGPTTVVEQKAAVPLALRGRVEDDGQLLVIEPIETSHALDSATVAANGRIIEVGSDGRVSAAAVQKLVGDADGDEAAGSLRVTATANYVEAGSGRTATGRYRIAYRWRDGGLFGGRQLRITGFSRS